MRASFCQGSSSNLSFATAARKFEYAANMAEHKASIVRK